jgi:hypothetical protein
VNSDNAVVVGHLTVLALTMMWQTTKTMTRKKTITRMTLKTTMLMDFVAVVVVDVYLCV